MCTDEDEDGDDEDEGDGSKGGPNCTTCYDWKYVKDANGNLVPCPDCNS